MKLKLKDPVSGGLHFITALLAIPGLILLMQQAREADSPLHLVGYMVFGLSMIFLYTASSVHHLIPKRKRSAKLFRRIDHSMIFVLIAGTYTPICLISLKGLWGWSLLAVVWLLSLLGIWLKLSGTKVPRRLSTALYVGLGWAAASAVAPLIKAITLQGFLWILAGGLFYTVGAVIYAFRKPDPLPEWFGFHEIFHLFVMAGSVSHFWAIFHYVR
jgi:hemolysin III